MIAGLLWRVGPWLALAVSGLVIWGLWQANEAQGGKLAAAEAVIAQREADAKLSAVVVAQLSQKLIDTETKVITQVERIYAAPVTRECAASPAMRASSDGMRDLFRSAGSPDAGRLAPPALR